MPVTRSSKRAPDGQENVAVGDAHVGLEGPVHPQHAEKKRVVAGEPAEAHQGGGDGDGHLLGQGEELFVGVGDDHAAPGVDHGLLGLRQQVEGFLDLSGVPLVRGVVPSHFDFGGVAEFGAVGDDVLGEVHQHRSRPAGAGDVRRPV